MRRIYQYILLALTLSVVSLSLHSCGKKGVIDEDVLSQIYAEMLMTDQWINSTPGVRLIADTSLVYEPVLKKYGYTSAEYRNSVEHYLKDPEEYSDIMLETMSLLDKRLEELKVLKAEKEKEKNRQAFIKKIGRDVNFDKSWIFVDRLKDERFGSIDSLSLVWDSLSRTYKMSFVPWAERSDSVAVKDSLSQLDSLQVIDSLLVRDSLHVIDSLHVKDSIADRPKGENLRNIMKKMNVGDSLIKINQPL